MECLYCWFNSHTGIKPLHLVQFPAGRTIPVNGSEQTIPPTVDTDGLSKPNRAPQPSSSLSSAVTYAPPLTPESPPVHRTGM